MNFVEVTAASVDEAEDALSRIYGEPARLVPSHRTPHVDMRLRAFQDGGVTLGQLRYGPELSFVTSETKNFHIDIPLVGGMEVHYGGQREPVEATIRRAAIFTPGQAAELRWQAHCTQRCIMIDHRALHQELEQILGRAVSKPLEFDKQMDLTTPHARSWLGSLAMLYSEAERPDGLLQVPLFREHLQHLIIAGLLYAQRNTYTDAIHGDDLLPPPRAVRQAVALIQAHPEKPWSATSLAREALVSVRSLQEGFRRSYGMPPMAYLQKVRLARAHGDLLTSEPGETTVGTIAARWGFFHVGRFSGTYRRKYGRQPSHTLRKLP